MKAIILAGGLGERLRPLTNKIPKPLLPVKGKPIMQYAIESLKKHGIVEIIIGISYNAEKIKKYFGDGSKFGTKISYSIEKIPLGTGGGVKQAAKNLTDPFILFWGDILMDIDFTKMRRFHKKRNPFVTMAVVKREDVENFGALKIGKEDKIISFVEKPPRDEAPSNLINAGVFIVNPKALDILPLGKSSIEEDCFKNLAGKKGKILAFKHKGQWFPTDTLEKYTFANKNWKVFS